MPGPSPSPGPIQFGPFRVNVRAGELRKDGIRVRLQDQPFRVLHVLLEHPGEVVTREELQQQIWPSDTFVDFDRGLNNAVMRLREALSDSADQPRYIETLPKRGYRFIGTIHEEDTTTATRGATAPTEAGASGENRSAGRNRRFRATVLKAVFAGLVLVALTFGWPTLRNRFPSKAAAAPPIHSIAVLPLQNLSGDPNQEYFADGLTDALITDLAQIASLKVISRTSTMRYKNTGKPLPEIARELNVDGIVEGTVQREGDRVRITAQLVQARTDTHIWARSYERDTSNVLTLEAEAANSLAEGIQAQLTPQEKARLAQSRPVSLQVLEDYLQGEHHLNNYGKGYDAGELKRAAMYFQQAINEDPSFAPAYIRLAETFDWQDEMLPPKEVMPREKAVAEKALSLDPDLSDGHLALGRVYFQYEWNWSAAEKELTRAIQLNPSNAKAHEALGDYLEAMGRLNEGLDEQQRAEELDPHAVPDHLSNGLYRTRQYDRGIQWLRKQIEINPNEGVHYGQLSLFYEETGMQKEYIATLARFLTLYGLPDVAESLRRNFAAAGYEKALRELCLEVESLERREVIMVPGQIATLYNQIGNEEQALHWLEVALEERDGGMPYLNCDPEWDSLRSDPRFKEIVRRVGLPQ
jgi:TolB-like protein/DNA-binding winged helix-turn-helix (wHTH) protein